MTARIQTAQAFGKVAVLMGGRSAEREISLRSEKSQGTPAVLQFPTVSS